MNKREIQLTSDVMRRVRFVHGLRVLMTPAFLRVAVFAVSLATTLGLVSVKHVIENMSRIELSSYVPYLAHSYVSTSLYVEVAMVAAFAAALWLVRDILHTWSMFRASKLSYRVM